MRSASSSFFALFTVLAVGLVGCSSSSSSGAGSGAAGGCKSSCESAGGAVQKVCGTNKVTYDACDWDCGGVPAEVSIFPGACQADGSPAADAPTTPADGAVVCDYLRIGDAWQPIECASGLDLTDADDGSSYLGGMDGSQFVAVARAANVHLDGPAPPDAVDHRARYGAVKNQGAASSCTAFAMTAALEGAIAASIGDKSQLSDMHLWSRYYSPNGAKCLDAVKTGGVATLAEATMNGLPYDEKLAADWENKKSQPDSALVSKLDGLGLFTVVRADPLKETDNKPSVEDMKKSLAEGNDLFVAVFTSDAWSSPSNGVIADYAPSTKGGHAILVVGYKNIDGKPYFIFRNSWGPWADGGYGYISFTTMQANVMAAVSVAVGRKSAAPTCPDGQSADLRGTCKKICDDKSLADDAGNCGPPMVSCPAGQTADAASSCVTACKAGDVMGTDFKVSCSDRACTWTVNPGAGACPAGGQACTQTCPAPTCAVVIRKNELGQTIMACAAPNQ